MSDAAVSMGTLPDRNRALSAFAGLGAVTVFSMSNATLSAITNGAGFMDGWSHEAILRYQSTLGFMAWLLGALGAVAIGWWMRKQGSWKWGVSILAVAALADGFSRTMDWLRSLQAAQEGISMGFGWSLFFPVTMPVAVLVGLVLAGAGLQKLRERMKS